MSSDNATKRILDHVTDPGECCFSLFKKCCVASKQVDYFNDIADLINDMFQDEAFVPTDIAAALILLSEKNQCNLVESGQAQRSMKNKEIHLRHLDTYMAYAFAIYGCTLYLLGKFFHTFSPTRLLIYLFSLDSEERMRNCWNLCKKVSFCSCCCCSASSQHLDFTEGDNCYLGHLATLQLQVPHLQTQDIVHVSLKNGFLETPYLISADPSIGKIVIAIRGTLSIADLMTDLAAKPVSLRDFLLEKVDALQLSTNEMANLQSLDPDIQVHAGMAEAAIYVFKEIKKKHLLDKAFVEYPDYALGKNLSRWHKDFKG